MRPMMMSKEKVVYLFTHVLDGFKSSQEGIVRLRDTGLIKEDEYAQLMEKNAQRLIDRIKEFRLAERLLSAGFAALFFWLQISNEDLEMRRPGRVRPGRRKNESENVITF